MSKLKNMRVIRIPPFRAVSSGEKNSFLSYLPVLTVLCLME